MGSNCSFLQGVETQGEFSLDPAHKDTKEDHPPRYPKPTNTMEFEFLTRYLVGTSSATAPPVIFVGGATGGILHLFTTI